jgi:hypothetical protein
MSRNLLVRRSDLMQLRESGAHASLTRQLPLFAADSYGTRKKRHEETASESDVA